MANFSYYGFVFKQMNKDLIPEFFMFNAPVGEILQWADIRRLEDEPGAPQRTTSIPKVKAVTKFIEDEGRNTIPTAIILTIDVLPEKLTRDIQCGETGESSICKIELSIEESQKKPGLVIDGQHRLLGLNEVDPACRVSVVALLNVDDDEKAFQFLVINNKSTKVSSDHIRALALSYKEDDLKDRLRAARLSLSPVVDFVGIVNDESDSPFKGIISWPTNPQKDRIVVPSSIETAITKIQQRRLKPLESDDVLLEFFYSIWKTIKEEWSSVWNADSKLIQKIGIVCMTEYITDALIASYDWGRIDISNPDDVSKNVKDLLKYQEKTFWTLPWTSTSYDTKAGRELVVSSLVKLARNIRSEDVWNEGIALIDRSED